MIKNITVLEIRKNGKDGEVKEFDLHIKTPCSYGELFDVSMEIRDFAMKGMSEIAAKDAKIAEEMKANESVKEG